MHTVACAIIPISSPNIDPLRSHPVSLRHHALTYVAGGEERINLSPGAIASWLDGVGCHGHGHGLPLPDVVVAYVRVHGPLIRQTTLEYLLELGDAVNADDIAAIVGVADAPDDDVDPALAAVVDEALKMVDALSDDDGLSCPICTEEDDDMAAWKETPCGHRFHGRCVERWLLEKGSCPMCRHQVVAMPDAADESYVYISLSQDHGQDVSNPGDMEIDAASS